MTILKYLNLWTPKNFTNIWKNKNILPPHTGLDDFQSRFIIDGSSIIASPLAHIVNLSLIQGVVPGDAWLGLFYFAKRVTTHVGNYKLII